MTDRTLRHRWWRQKRWIAATVWLAVAPPVSLLALLYARHEAWHGPRRDGQAIVRRLESMRPDTADLAVWKCATEAIETAYGNICFSPEHVSMAEMRRLRNDLDAKLRGPVDMATLAWIWNRLGETGPHGRRYIKRFKSLFHDCTRDNSSNDR